MDVIPETEQKTPDITLENTEGLTEAVEETEELSDDPIIETNTRMR